MRIIGGKFKGRILKSVRDLSVRPTSDRAKQIIFDVLSNRIDFDGIEVVDFFAGSGSLGLEAISRGAKKATFIDKSRKSLNVIEENVNALGCKNQCFVHQADVFWYIKNVPKKFDLIFADPPYKLEKINLLPKIIYTSGILHDGSYLIMEHYYRSVVELDEKIYEVTKKNCGQTVILILKSIMH